MPDANSSTHILCCFQVRMRHIGLAILAALGMAVCIMTVTVPSGAARRQQSPAHAATATSPSPASADPAGIMYSPFISASGFATSSAAHPAFAAQDDAACRVPAHGSPSGNSSAGASPGHKFSSMTMEEAPGFGTMEASIQLESTVMTAFYTAFAAMLPSARKVMEAFRPHGSTHHGLAPTGGRRARQGPAVCCCSLNPARHRLGGFTVCSSHVGRGLVRGFWRLSSARLGPEVAPVGVPGPGHHPRPGRQHLDCHVGDGSSLAVLGRVRRRPMPAGILQGSQLPDDVAGSQAHPLHASGGSTALPGCACLSAAATCHVLLCWGMSAPSLPLCVANLSFEAFLALRRCCHARAGLDGGGTKGVAERIAAQADHDSAHAAQANVLRTIQASLAAALEGMLQERDAALAGKAAAEASALQDSPALACCEHCALLLIQVKSMWPERMDGSMLIFASQSGISRDYAVPVTVYG